MTTIEAFIEKWADSEGSERSHSQHFLIDLCDLVGLPRPGTKPTDEFRFEKDADFDAADGVHHGRADLVRKAAFVIESKQFTKKERASKAWNLGMQEALGQALGYAKGLEQPPVFVIACDVGHCFELLACFDGSGHWRPFPSSANRIYLADLRDAAKYNRLATALKDPTALDPSRAQVEITTDVAAKIATLAKTLRAAGHAKETVARFLMRCLFTMFAEDVGLFDDKKKVFAQHLRDYWIKSPASFPTGASVLWQTMNTGGFLPTGERVQRFNGGLFRDHAALPMTKAQLEILLEAAQRDWSQVEPAIFGTLLENALGDRERHSLGAHFTPRAYVERLVRPTIEEPLRTEWLDVRYRVRKLLGDGNGKSDEKGALAELKAFHQRLCKIKVLDPACGTGNFLYVAMDLMKQLEAEVLEQIRRVGGSGQELLELDTITVSPAFFLGIEKNPWAKEIAELVLWIGYLRWQWRLRGTTAIAQTGGSILRDERNIEWRDAVLDWDGAPLEQPLVDERGRPLSRWDGETVKVDPVSGHSIPDETAKVAIFDYPNARKADWPRADFIIGNPPFVGNKRMRLALGDGYVDALRASYPEVPESADYVMYWWKRCAELVRTGSADRFGLITTNSITQPFNRRVVQEELDRGLGLSFAIPDHPWVDSDSGAAVRIAMTVGTRHPGKGTLARVAREAVLSDGAIEVDLETSGAEIGAALRPTAHEPRELASNRAIGFRGVTLVGDGFIIDDGDALDASAAARTLVGASALLGKKKPRRVLDFLGISSEQELRTRYPREYQHLRHTVYHTRAAQERPSYRDKWWVFAEPRREFRAAVQGLPRYIGTVETSKFRWFAFIEASALPEQTLIAFALSDAALLGVLSSRVHGAYAVARGSRNGKGNDPRYTIGECFDSFPFPVLSSAQHEAIANLAEQIDRHRQRALSSGGRITMTALYNVVEKLRASLPLDKAEKQLHDAALVSILRELHDELDAAVIGAYGWEANITDEAIVERLAELNAARLDEERARSFKPLRPDLFAAATEAVPATEVVTQPPLPFDTEPTDTPSSPPPRAAAATRAWPRGDFERAPAIRELVRSLPDGARFDAAALDAHFKGTGKNRVREIAKILDTFAALGEFVTLAPGYYARPARRAA